MASNSNEWQPAWQIDELRPILMANENDKTNKLGNDSVVTGTPFNDIPHVEAQPNRKCIHRKTYSRET